MNETDKITIADIQRHGVEKTYHKEKLELQKLEAEIAILVKQAELIDVQIARAKTGEKENG